MANQDTPLWETLTSFNMAMVLNIRLLIIPPEHRTIEEGKALLMVNNRATYQRQSLIPDAPAGEQALLISSSSNNNCLVPAIIEDHKLYFNPHIISLMFTWDPEDCITWDVHWSDQSNMCNINQGMHNALKVPITIINDADINSCITCWTGEWKYKR